MSFVGGHYLLITDCGGYDLPGPAEPCRAMCLSRRDELIEIADLLRDVRELFRWIRHTERLGRVHEFALGALRYREIAGGAGHSAGRANG